MNDTYLRIYQETIEKLKNSQRPQIRLTLELIEELKLVWEKALVSSQDQLEQLEAIKKILCILDNSQNTTSEFNDLFIKTLKEIKDSEILIYTLSASQKHVVADGLKNGKMISMEYFLILKELLLSKNPEITEWTLRTIETMGPLSLRFKKEVIAVKPGFLKFFNQHHKNSSQLIEYLEKEWVRMLG